jgi:ribonuclease HII
MKILGIDEAGRGPVIGPMVMAGVLLEEKNETLFKNLGVKDSKQLTPNAREALFEKIKGIALDYDIIIIHPEEIDETLNSENTNLNNLEAIKSAMITNKIYARSKFDKVILDCPSNNIEKYKDYFQAFLKQDIEIVAEHKADSTYIIVSAASILAKVTRDRLIEDLKIKYKVDFGSGYPSDPMTIAFVKKNYNAFPFFRRTWQTYKTAAGILDEKKPSKQKGLLEFS